MAGHSRVTHRVAARAAETAIARAGNFYFLVLSSRSSFVRSFVVPRSARFCSFYTLSRAARFEVCSGVEKLRARKNHINYRSNYSRRGARMFYELSRATGGRLNRINSGTLEADNFLRVLAGELGKRTRRARIRSPPFPFLRPDAVRDGRAW